MRIPESFMLFGSKINIVWDNDFCNKMEMYGQSDMSQHRITMSTTCGVKPLSEDHMKDTFYHEKVHIILDMMKEYDLSKNEKFVDIFSKLLRQSDETAQY